MGDRDSVYADGREVGYVQWPDTVDGMIDDNGTVRPMTPAEVATWQARTDAEAADADRAARIQALAAKSVSQLETSASQIDGRAAVYEAFPDVTTNGQAVTRVNVITDDVAALARRVADLQQTVAHLIRLTVIDNG